MEQEVILSGYCKTIDNSRTVMVEEGEPDCLFSQCPHVQNCPVAEKIRQILEEQ